jgi:hypothetical protein
MNYRTWIRWAGCDGDVHVLKNNSMNNSSHDDGEWVNDGDFRSRHVVLVE